jgi:hypothetical protein
MDSLVAVFHMIVQSDVLQGPDNTQIPFHPSMFADDLLIGIYTSNVYRVV